MTRILNVFLHSDFLGQLEQDRSGTVRFKYDEQWITNPKAIPLSRSLPLRKETFRWRECKGFFSGILPENEIRRIIAENLHVSVGSDFRLLERIGGECAGAVTFLPLGEKPVINRDAKYHFLTEAELAQILRELPKCPLLAGKQHVRLSLAGAQNKLAVFVKENQIAIPLDGSPSSHILKPAVNRFKNIVANEAFCLRLANNVRIPAAKASICTVEDIEYLLVERYDRTRNADGSLQRIHQEDFCQALAFSPEMKYEKEGGPSLKRCFQLVREVSSKPPLDIRALLDAVVFNALIGNNDAHGKNFSLLYQTTANGYETRFAPLYDLVCTSVYPDLSPEMAMKIGKVYDFKRITFEEWKNFSQEVGLSIALLKSHIIELIAKITQAIDEMKEIKESSTQLIAKLIQERCTEIINRLEI